MIIMTTKFIAIFRALLVAFFLIATSNSFAQKFNDGGSNRMLIFNTAMDELSDSIEKVDIQLGAIARLQIPSQQKLKIMDYVSTYKKEANNLLDATKVIDSAIRLALLVDAEKDIKKLRGMYVYQICLNMPAKLISDWYAVEIVKSRIENSKGYGKEVSAPTASINAVVELIEKTNALGIKFNVICSDAGNLSNW